MSWFSKPIGGAISNEDELIRNLLSEFTVAGGHRIGRHFNMNSLPSFQTLMAMDRTRQAQHVHRLASWLVESDAQALEFRNNSPDRHNPHMQAGWNELWETRSMFHTVMSRLLGKKLPLSGDTLVLLLDMCLASDDGYMMAHHYPVALVVTAIEARSEAGDLPETITAKLVKLGERLANEHEDTAIRKVNERIQTLLNIAPEIPVEPGEVWADALIEDLTNIGKAERAAWIGLLHHCKSATGGAPAAKWLKQTEMLLENLDKQQINGFLSRWFALTDKNRSHTAMTLRQWAERCAEGAFGKDLLIIPAHMELLAGLAWVSGLVANAALTRSLGILAVSMYRKVPGKGPRAVRVGNACITALGLIGDTHALGQLAWLKVKVKFGGAQAAIDKTMTKLAEKLGVSTEDLEEMSVPAYGMTEVGCLTQQFGEFTAHLTVMDSRSTVLVWTRDDGKPQKSVPAAVKQEFTDDLKELMAAKKDIEKMLPAQAERLDGIYLRRKSWPFAMWRERYLDHPLTGSLVRRLLWNFTLGGETVTGVWLKDRLVDRLGNPISVDVENTVVSMWHPLHQESRIVFGWRGFLDEWQIVQPFKQAHREVYLLTPAEEETSVYSNRFAAHLLRQHQFNALCAARGWKNSLRLMVDSTYPPATRWLPEWGLRAEYWIDGAGSEYGEDTLESGAYRYVTTDQIRFYPIDAPQVTAQAGTGSYGTGWRNGGPSEPIPLAQVDPLVFSEVMRDADLFVGVGSVGNDPNWLDGGRNELRRDYWQSVSFGELNASAQTRKLILGELVPKLKIAAACSFEEKFLIVQGKLHRYKIHLGSGNILIMPRDKYLCIVPAQGQLDKASERIFLPFEGDRTLSLILSKAFLLAADDKITDATILRQLG